ncbi:hypothetical protein M422DRAFT_244046 [Sphaerobolus stellatus SS14]|nr:hypothetical protein M422DRAFT_244046 [Sphaerobolus stellatus SS14]
MLPNSATNLNDTHAALSAALHNVPEKRKESHFNATFELAQSETTNLIAEGAKEIFSAIKSQLGTFVQASEGLTRALDELGKLHPFVAVAVIPFKAAITLEIKRKENDKKVLVLFVQMSEMMKTLRVLESIKPEELGEEGGVITGNIKTRLETAAKNIQDCSHVTHEYYKMKFIPKFFKSFKWEEKFTEFATAFTMLTSDIKTDLELFIGTGVQNIHHAELELSAFVTSKGGLDKFTSDDKLLLDLVKKREEQVSRSPRGRARILREKFKEQQSQLRKLRTVVYRESDRIIEHMQLGVHNRILDKVLYFIWVEMKGSAKAQHVVLAIRDFYIEKLQQLASVDNVSSVKIETDDSKDVAQSSEIPKRTRVQLAEAPAVAPKDRLCPLLEALDPDCSGFITINEINEFTSARPKDWSLPHWLAYWTVEVPSLLQKLSNVDKVVTGIHTFRSDGTVTDEYQHPSFYEYTKNNEQRIKKRLETFGYLVDKRNTLSLVIGPGRFKEHILPPVYLILWQTLHIFEQGKSRVIKYDKLSHIMTSLSIICSVLEDHMAASQGAHLPQEHFNISDDSLNQYYHLHTNEGLDEDSESYFNMLDSHFDPAIEPDIDYPNNNNEGTQIPVPGDSYSDDTKMLDSSGYEDINRFNEDSENPQLAGHWYGFYYYVDGWDTDGIMGFQIKSTEMDGSFMGGGIGPLVEFSIKGTLEGSELTFTKEYQLYVYGGYLIEQPPIWLYRGTVEEGFYKISGMWGPPPPIEPVEGVDIEPSQPDDYTFTENDHGTFIVYKRPVELIQFRPSEQDFIQNRPHALWKFVLNAIHHNVSNGAIRWSTLKL